MKQFLLTLENVFMSLGWQSKSIYWEVVPEYS